MHAILAILRPSSSWPEAVGPQAALPTMITAVATAAITLSGVALAVRSNGYAPPGPATGAEAAVRGARKRSMTRSASCAGHGTGLRYGVGAGSRGSG